MDDIDLQETALRSAWRFCSSIIFASHPNRKLVGIFWLAEVLGGAVTGAVDGWLAVVWLVLGLVLLFVGGLANAPYRQRNEARDLVRSGNTPIGLPSPWISLDDALQYLYDALTSGAYDASGQLGRMISDLGEDSSDL